jgi:hypothetical protein
MTRNIAKVVPETLAAAWRAMPLLWKESTPVLPRAAGGLQVPLRPSPLARRAVWLLLALQGLYLVQLVYLGHVVVATLVAALGSALAWHLRRRIATQWAAQRLLLSADGRLHLLVPGGRLLAATLHPASMRLGAWLLLVLRAGTDTHRLLLGPDNVDPALLSALRRRIASIPGR